MSHDVDPAYVTQADLWLARGAILAAIVLQMSLINGVWFGARFLTPTLEISLFIPLIALSARSEWLARKAKRSGDWEPVSRYRSAQTMLVRSLAILISLANALALLALIRALLGGSSRGGRTLLIDAVNIWTTNVIVFALWYWQLDRGGPSIDRTVRHTRSDFLFPQMVVPPDHPAASENPGFVDYLFLSFTTCTAFSPTDTLPLTSRMKLLMMLESLTSLLTIAIVAARAVNILA
jgi:hypothetical protein